MKKIGILTFHYSNNFGGVLQCYALYNFLKPLYVRPLLKATLMLAEAQCQWQIGGYPVCKEVLMRQLA